jgi:hypothetical protein
MGLKRRSRDRHKGRQTSGTFSRLPHAVQDSSSWRQCSGTAAKLLLDMIRLHNGRNNGDICATLKVLRKFGWTRGATINAAVHELLHYGLIELTRQGGLNRPNLYALTWIAIDECGGKLDCASPTKVASGLWSEHKDRYRRPSRKKMP